MLEPGEGGKVTVPQDCGPLPGPGAEGDRDHALFIRFVFLAVDPGGGLGAGLVGLVDDMEFVAGRSGFLEQAKGALAYEDPAADPVSDELDDDTPRFLSSGKAKVRETRRMGDSSKVKVRSRVADKPSSSIAVSISLPWPR